MHTANEKTPALLRTAYKALELGHLGACVEMLTENFIANVPGVSDPLHGRAIWRRGAEAMWEGN